MKKQQCTYYKFDMLDLCVSLYQQQDFASPKATILYFHDEGLIYVGSVKTYQKNIVLSF